MPYIYRDENGVITGHSKWKNDDSQDFLAEDSQEFIDYLHLPTEQDLFIKECELSVQSMLDSKAKDLGYDSVMTCVSYADEPSVEKFQLDGIAIRAWRSGCWAKCYEILATSTVLPTLDEVMAQMPVYGA